MLLFVPLACAQSARDVSAIVHALPEPSQRVVERLAQFNNLPAGEWRFHAGDIAHGEDPALDDSDWTLVQSGSKAPVEAVWYRRMIEVPQNLYGYGLTGARIWFQFQAGANGPVPQIIYFNGRRVAMGDNLEPIVLFDQARPGDKILVAVKILATVDKKSFHGVSARIDFAPGRPNPGDLRTEFLTSAALIPSLSKNPAADLATLNQAIQAVDLDALDRANQARFDASLTDAREKLAALGPVLQQATLHLSGNSHIDAAWLWPVSETVDVVKNTWATALQLMNEYPDYTFTQSSAVYNDWIATKYPAINEEIKKRVKEGRWEIVGGMWVEPDLNMPDGESLVRSLLIGKRYFAKEYGVDVRIGWNVDSFGYNWQLPQIYKRSGMDYFVTQKMAWNDTNQLPFKLFWWQSPDGSRVLTYFPHDYANTNLSPLRLGIDMAAARKYAPGMEQMMDLYGVSDHGGGPTRAMLDEGLHWMQPGMIVPRMHFGTAQSYFTEIGKQISPNSPTLNYAGIARGYAPPAPESGKIVIPTWNDEMYFEYHRGIMTTQAQHKRNMREGEVNMLNAERLAALAWVQGGNYPGPDLTDDWKTIAFNDFHDTAAGSAIGVVYKEAQRDFSQLGLSTGEITRQAITELSAPINTRAAGEVPILVVNPMGWARGGLTVASVQMPENAPDGISILDPEGNVLPSRILDSDPKTSSYRMIFQVKKVPALGYVVLHAVAGTKPFATDLKTSGTTMENTFLCVTVDPVTGCITSIFDKRTGSEALAKGACGNQLQTFKDTPKQFDAWNIDAGALDQMTPIEKADSVVMADKGPMSARVQVDRAWQNSKFRQDVELDAFSDVVNIVNLTDWHETHVLLKAAFPLAVSAPAATYEIPYGSIERPVTRNNSWEKAKFEVPALRWADLSDGQRGVSLLNQSKYGYDARDNVLRLTLLRSPAWPDPDADHGQQQYSYALYPHASDWRQALTVRRGYEYNYPLLAWQVEAHAGTLPIEHSWVSVEPENVVLTAVKRAEDTGSLVLRAYEWEGKQSTVTFNVPEGATAATATNLMEKPEGQPLTISGNKVTAKINPYEILTVRVDYPRAGPN